jgi:Na+-translocating ferredoxin:NAD+ oxidoreductase RnfG subunit
MRFTPATTTLACLALAPAAAFAVDYMTPEQAAKTIFPDADSFEPHTLALDAAALQKLESAGLRPRSAQWTVQAARHAGKTLGWVVVDNVVGKFELITYAVGLNADGSVKQVEILSYRESHGQEVRLPAWRKQFAGKTATSPIRVGEDIANISGATLSCTHVTEGVRRIVAVVDLARKQGLL